MSNPLPDRPNNEESIVEGSFSIDELQGPSQRLQNISFSSAGSSCPLDYSDDASLTIPVSPVSQDSGGDDDEKERKTTTLRAHNPSRKDVNARIKRARIHFDHFHAHLSDRSTRTARISNAKPSFLHGGNHHLSSKSHKSPKTFARKEKKVYKYDNTRT